MQAELEELWRARGIPYRLLQRQQLRLLRQQWLATFAANVWRHKGSEVFGGFMWHGFSFRFEPALEGVAALRKYQQQTPAPFLVFSEDWDFSFHCEPAAEYPDLTEFGTDLYVAHHQLAWTMAFTHEQPGIGPFFSTNPADNPA